ncbi:MAG: branched-chain amino acid transaminase [Planctomycetes bacterium]|nr:branched-chain amino acid transaminase [Planctomycetota bacterium]
MPMREAEFIWMDGTLVPWAAATVHVMTHALHYGSSIFEGIRVYRTPGGPRFFRLPEHVHRLFDSARIYAVTIPFDEARIRAACGEVVAKNGLQSAYVRPIAYQGYGPLGVDPGDQPARVAIIAVDWGRYLGADAIEKGVDVQVSSWGRIAPNTLPLMAKAGGNYLSGWLVHAEARRNGFAEGIAVGADGTVVEGAGENLFVIRDGVAHTPGITGSVLEGITRHTVLTLLGEQGIPVREGPVPRELLYVADEVFLTGTAAEITPVRSVDRRPVGSGTRGPITEALQDAFFGLFDGRREDRHGWLSLVDG